MTYSQMQADARKFVRRRRPSRQLLIIAGVRAAADEIVRQSCDDALAGVHRFALREFVYAISSRALNERGWVPVRGVVREALAARIVAVALREKNLSYLHRVAAFPGFARALSETLEDLRLGEVDTDRLRGSGQSGPDLARLLDAYTRELRDRNLADHADRVQLALQAIQSEKYRFDKSRVLFVEVTPHTTAERRLLDAVTRRATDVLDLSLKPAAGSPRTCLESLQMYIERAETPAPRPMDATFELFSASGEALECVEIARRIARAAESGVRFDQIGILLRSPERYQPLIVEALRRARIPGFYTRGVARPDPVGRSFIALLECALEGLSASRFAEYMSLGQMPWDESGPSLPVIGERLLVDAAVIGGQQRWQTRLQGLTSELHHRYSRCEDDGDRQRIEKRIKEVETFSQFAFPKIERLASLPKDAVWSEWLPALHELADESLRRPQELHELLGQLAPLGEIGPVGLEQVLRVLAPRLSSSRKSSDGARYGKIFVGSIEEARGLSFRLVFLPGLNEGLFPGPSDEDPLLLNEVRQALALHTRTDDRELLHHAVACASEQLILSFSRLDLLTGRERVPSFYAFEAYRNAGGRDCDVSEFEQQARAGATTRIGWPAPQDPAAAIDDAEFDLATLAPRTKGTGEYLKHLPGRSVHALRARWYRWHKPWKPADGLIVEEIGDPALPAYRLAKRPYAVSALQQFARCPYRFALHSIFQLRPQDTVSRIQRIHPDTRGELYHRVQFELMRDLKAQNLLPMNAGNFNTVIERLEQILERSAAEYAHEFDPAIPQVWKTEIDAIRADLRGWARYKAVLEPDWTPMLFEFGFGVGNRIGHDPHSSADAVAITADAFQIKGSIDLIERHSTNAIRVVDHKTGKIPDPKPHAFGGGEVLQPALYGMAAEELLRERVVSGRLFFSTLKQNYDAIDVALDENTRRRAGQVLQTIDKAVRDGFLPAAPRKDGCKGCEYLPVCGPYEEDRIAAKSQPELKPLKEVRSLR
ncbi:MAG TPA: PD-(D/E)XK nuclease family protein [Bryobacteraceae bacterium]|nr:PD-(D/E)XK nuclease family protein [Bryobacteraceae bacterium]